jgi:hypothetical protein
MLRRLLCSIFKYVYTGTAHRQETAVPAPTAIFIAFLHRFLFLD